MDDVDEMMRRQTQKQKLFEESKWPPPAKLPRQHLQKGNDAIVAVVVRPTRSRFSPGKLCREGGKGRKDDYFNKVNGARGRRRHRSASGTKAFATTPFQPRADG
jgi:hypothetical protein